jgi:glycosyltransferase involved in cell wall biosynthesis
MQLRIAHVINEPFGLQTANGVQHAVYCLARAQSQLGESVAVFSRDDHAVHIVSDDTGPPRHNHISGDRAGRSVRDWLLSGYFERSLADDILAWTPDIVHFHSVHVPQNVALAPYLRRAGVPYCVTVHGALFRPALRRRRLKKAVFNLLFERHYLNEAQFIHALTAHEREALRQYGIKRPVVVVPNGLPPGTDVRPSRPDVLYASRPRLRHRQVFMFIGRMDAWQKGLDLLVEAFAAAALHDAALVLVGPD